MTTQLDAKRTALHDALVAGLPETRVEKYTPSQVAAPVVWIDSAQINTTTVGIRGTIAVATFPVYCVVDGGVTQQLEALDSITASAWDAATRSGGNPVRAASQSVDAGGPNLRAVVIDVDIPITARTLCAL